MIGYVGDVVLVRVIVIIFLVHLLFHISIRVFL